MAVQSTISDIQSAGATAQQQAAARKDNSAPLGKNDFLKLLTAQLQQQDPTQPMDSTAFVAQLAQFSTLEQMSNTNETLGSILAAQATSLQMTAASFVGKTAVFNTDQVTLEEGKPATISADLSQPAANVTIVIQDDQGNTVRTLALGAAPSGSNRFTWDGRDDSGDEVAAGHYTVQVLATDVNGNPISLTQSGSARITGISFNGGAPTFRAGGSSVQLSDILELDE
jgi:flagellar basal-body rod modification protein FlgD